jgi:hypothetical protein
MPKADLQQWLISRSGFRERYLRVLKESVASQFQSLQRADEAPQTERIGPTFCSVRAFWRIPIALTVRILHYELPKLA